MIAKSGHTKVWTTLITNIAYLPGLLTLEYSLRKVGSKYPLVVIYTDTFPAEGHAALDARGILKQQVPYLSPSIPKDFSDDVRFYDCWSKLTSFSLVEFDRVVQLDSDMLVLQNMDELMDLDLDSIDLAGAGNRVFAASHACTCNPLRRPHYPKTWIPANCAFTSQHPTPETAQSSGAPSTAGLGTLNSGLLVINPSQEVYDMIIAQLATPATASYAFPDQDLLADVFAGRWVALPYIYNALKTLRRKGVHDAIWRDGRVKNVHYILSPKPWDSIGEKDKGEDPTFAWWRQVNAERVEDEQQRGHADEF